MEYTVKLVAALPKGDPNGFADSILAEDLARAKLEGRGRVHVAVIVYDVKDAIVGDEGVVTAKARARYVQPVQTEAGRRVVEAVLRDEYTAQTGQRIVPFEIASVVKAAFADLPKTAGEIDEQEERERENMSRHDELRMHLIRVHGREDAGGLTDAEAEQRHEADHDGDMPAALQHDRKWRGWTRADIEVATADSDDESGAGESGVILTPLTDDDTPEPGGLFNDGMR